MTRLGQREATEKRESEKRLRRFERELDRVMDLHYGHRGKLEDLLGKSRGFFSRMRQKGWRCLTIGDLAVLAEATALGHWWPYLELVPAARAVRRWNDPEAVLGLLLASASDEEKSLIERLERSTAAVEHGETPKPPERHHGGRAEELLAFKVNEQRRKLRSIRKFQRVEVLDAYLDELDERRHHGPRDAALLAQTVASEVTPKALGGRLQRLELQVKALAVFGSACRAVRRFTIARSALCLAMSVVRTFRLGGRLYTDLLERSAYLMRDVARFELALDFLRSAEIDYSDRGLRIGLGRARILRGMTLLEMGRDFHDDEAARVLKRGHTTLWEPWDDEASRPWRAWAHYGVAVLEWRRGHLDEALLAVDQALEISRLKGASRARWMRCRAMIRLEQEAPAEAVEHLCDCLGQLRQRQHPLLVAFVMLDLMAARLAAGEPREAVYVAQEMACLVKPLEEEPAAVAALREILSGGDAGQVDAILLATARRRLAKACDGRWIGPDEPMSWRLDLLPGLRCSSLHGARTSSGFER